MLKFAWRRTRTGGYGERRILFDRSLSDRTVCVYVMLARRNRVPPKRRMVNPPPPTKQGLVEAYNRSPGTIQAAFTELKGAGVLSVNGKRKRLLHSPDVKLPAIDDAGLSDSEYVLLMRLLLAYAEGNQDGTIEITPDWKAFRKFCGYSSNHLRVLRLRLRRKGRLHENADGTLEIVATEGWEARVAEQ